MMIYPQEDYIQIAPASLCTLGFSWCVIFHYLLRWNLELKQLKQLNHHGLLSFTICRFVRKAPNNNLYISYWAHTKKKKTLILRGFVWYIYLNSVMKHVFSTMSIPDFLICWKLHKNLNCRVPWNHSTNKCQLCILVRRGGIKDSNLGFPFPALAA